MPTLIWALLFAVLFYYIPALSIVFGWLSSAILIVGAISGTIFLLLRWRDRRRHRQIFGMDKPE